MGWVMGKLTSEDASFLIRHGIALAAAFDATGMSTRDWKAAMKAEGKFVAYGVSCLRGHSLKTRAGNCIRCNSANIAFARRAAKAGFVYIARSAELGLLKIGYSADDPDNRIYIARLEGYGGASDWRVKASIYAEAGGRLEFALHTALKAYHAPRQWERNWHECEARELYACTVSRAKTELFALMDAYGCSSS